MRSGGLLEQMLIRRTEVQIYEKVSYEALSAPLTQNRC